ncbi:MAG: S8 family serine peptidase, partial [Bacteroidota bacterium]
AANNGNVEANTDGHGVSVSGIVGARGNNKIGMTGVNWSVQLMTIKNDFINSEAEVLQAYSYALESRLAYDASGGAEGAYVVVTNASWGRDRGRPEDSPVWCGLYDRLGEVGILNMGAVINGDIDVDEEGDLPTNCPSDYLIGVTNLNTNDEKVTAAGFGSTSIDLGAYGENVFTTTAENSYGTFAGTSSATPHVTGAAALLYSAPCETFGQLLIADPSAAAIMVREIILSTTRPNVSLAGITVTGGGLDVGAAMDELMSRCDDCLAPTSFSAVPVTGSATDMLVDWRAIARLETINLRYRATGTEEWTVLTDVTAPYTISDLPACTSYEFQLIGNCSSAEVRTPILTATTDGCCVIPADFAVAASSNQRFIVSWSPLLAARSYRIRYRKVGEDNWLTRTSTNSQLGIAGGIEACTAYEFQFQTNCDTLVTDFGSTITLVSSGCGSCQEADYCEPTGYDNSREWIEEVNVGHVLVRRSGAEDGGYRNFGEVNERSFVRGGEYPVTLTPGFPNGEDREAFRVYVDWDQDGFFGNDELALETQSSDGPATGVLTVPDDAELLLTRMRVIMQFRSIGGSSCSDNRDGEVEDYCLNITDAEGCPPPPRIMASYLPDANLTVLEWQASAAPGGTYLLRFRRQNSNDAWEESEVAGIAASIADLNLCGTYEVELASICDGVVGEFRNFYFNDECTSTPERRLDAGLWSVFPNPAREQTTVRWPANLRAEGLRLFAADGRLLRSLTGLSTHRLELRLDGLAAGVYFVELRLQDGRAGLRRVVVR